MSAVDQADEAVRRKAQKTRAKAETGSGWYAGAARAGLVAKGISYGLVGLLAIGVAVGHGGKTTSRGGALETLADESWGKVLLILLAFGFAAYALWRFLQAIFEREHDDDQLKGAAKKWGTRAGYVGRGLIYAGLAYSTMHLLIDSSEQSQNEKARDTASTVFDWPAGRWLVAIVGLCIVGAGLWQLYAGVTREFEDDWRGGMSTSERKWGRRAGIVGHLARGVVFGLIGLFLVEAAVDYDSHDAIGLDGALQKLANAPYGAWLLGATAAGLMAYGLYCLVDARYRDVSA